MRMTIQARRLLWLTTFGWLAFVAGLYLWSGAWGGNGGGVELWLAIGVMPMPLFWAVAWFSDRRPDVAPDLLRAVVGRRPLEVDGLCFDLELRQGDGPLLVRLYYQNRYDLPCQFTIELQPRTGLGATPLSRRLLFDGEAQGGEFGLIDLPIVVPRQCLGQRCKYEAKGQTKHPQGRGRLLRFAGGRDAGEGSVVVQVLVAMILPAGLDALALSAMSAPTRALTFPLNPPPRSDADEPVRQTLWLPGDPLPQEAQQRFAGRNVRAMSADSLSSWK
jgi:hypothetical protein